MAAPTSSQLRDLLCAQIAAAGRAIEGKRGASDRAVHDARKQVKRARATLRLLRPAAGEEAYARENARLRDAVRPLAGVRDATITLETLEKLLEREGKRGQPRTLRDGLRAEQQRARRSLRASGALEEVRLSLAEADRQAARLELGDSGGEALRAAVQRLYRGARKALRAAADHGSDENLHEARKRIKYFALALEVLTPDGEGRLAKWARRADRLAKRLGEDHDLAVLQAQVAEGSTHARKNGTALPALAARRRKKLQRKALKTAARLYRRKPKAFGRRLERALRDAS